jgi:hypothetical protein
MKHTQLIDYGYLIQQNKEEFIMLLKRIIDIQYENFQKASIYAKVANIDSQGDDKYGSIFTYLEQEILEKEINRLFDTSIGKIHEVCPALTPKELLICCLSVQFSAQTISRCLGHSNTDAIRRQKSRIKKKMIIDSNNEFLFDFIFSAHP